MKKLILLLAIFYPGFIFAQLNYVIKVKFTNVHAPAKLFMFYKDGNNRNIDSAEVNNGMFVLSGKVKDTTLAQLILDIPGKGMGDLRSQKHPDFKQVYLVNSITYINGTDSITSAKISGNKVNEDLDHFNRLILPATRENMSATNEAQFDKANDDRKALSIQYLKSNSDSYVSLDLALQNIGLGRVNAADVEPYYLMLSKELRSTKAGVAYGQFIDALKSVPVGAEAPDFEQPDTNGKLIKLSSLRGKYILLDFWASWCVACRAENPNLVRNYEQYKDKNFTVISISLDRPGAKAAWFKAIHNDNLVWLQLADLKGNNNSAAKLYGVQAIPQNFLIDPMGKIIAKDLYEDDLNKKLIELFGKM